MLQKVLYVWKYILLTQIHLTFIMAIKNNDEDKKIRRKKKNKYFIVYIVYNNIQLFF